MLLKEVTTKDIQKLAKKIHFTNRQKNTQDMPPK